MGMHGFFRRFAVPPSRRPRRSRERRGWSVLSPRSVAGQVFLLQLAVVVLLVAVTAALLVVQARRQATEAARTEVLTAGEAFANAPGIVAALDSPDPAAVLQPRTQEIRKRSGLDTLVVINTDGTRYTHPDPDQIGRKFIGTIGPSLAGRVTIENARGPVRPGGEANVVQSVVPIFRPDGSVAGMVSPSVTVADVNEKVERQLPVLFGAAGGALVLAAGGSALVSRRLRRQTRGLGPLEMTRMYEHHDAVLHSVREGVLIVGDGRLLLANDEARRLLDLPPDAEQRQVTDLGLAPGTADLLASGRRVTDEVHLAGDRLLAVNVRPVDRRGGGPAGSVATLRDTTELRALAGRAEVARERLQLLYDAGVRIGTTLDVVRTAEELAEVAVPLFADFVTVELLEAVPRGEEPDAASAEMRRTALRGIHDDPPLLPVGELFRIASGSPVTGGRPGDVTGRVAGGRAVLVPDLAASDGWRAHNPEPAERILDYGIHSLISVPLRARGVVLGTADFWRSENEPFEQEDLSFAEELAARAAVSIDNARRYTREHTMAVTLQRSLLPHVLPEQSALEVAHRYQPARAGVGGVGGDWYDIIPLPGARVALVVGDVVGHGLHASATMGRLRTAVHNFSTLDLSPDELLGRLDELVTRIDDGEAAQDETRQVDGSAAAQGEAQRITGATCLYAIYDPVTGRCAIARAGHPGPAVVYPDGSVQYPEVPVSPPLGLGGGLPFETAELDLPAGSRLVLYTDGLIEDRHRDLDTGLELLRTALAGAAGRTPEETCRAVLDAVLPAHPSDDVALLVARTRLLGPDRVADWDVPSDPAAVSRVRADALRQLESWGLDRIAYATELVISELVTNAIRYGAEPIRLRLLHDRDSLICEVADGSSTSPHLRRAKTTDEGGRGLLLVARFTQRWGTRYTARGKVIWTEQSLHNGTAEPDGDAGDILLDQWSDTEL
ncbi:SpoIIE family protein phosphatase [Streptomyces violens]|uniref:SpoIIE family protein phosphatase n=1 Tax=Streptomyces violens TaxID=66377 RepID=UPI003CCBA089